MHQINNSIQQAKFILRFLRDELTVMEKEELDTWLKKNDKNRELFEEIVSGGQYKTESKFFEKIDIAAGWHELVSKVNKSAKIKRLPKNRSWWYVAAAAVLLIGGYALYSIAFQNNEPVSEIATHTSPQTDVAPGTNKAVLQLADGTQITLDSTNNGNIASQGKTKIIKINGQLAYNATGTSSEILYNTISTPRGGQYQLILSDGTKVWLNAASSLHFPTNFTGTERKVTLTGEGYFEVAKNAAMPFKVDVAGREEIEVLGTHFNINAYSDEPSLNTTLLEGRVKLYIFTGDIINKSLETILTPGQQAQLTPEGKMSIDKNPDIESIISWKEQKYIFNNAPLSFIMRQLQRWYDVEIIYEGPISNEEFVGIISRNVKISEILKMIEQTGNVRFKIEGRKIIVK